MKLERLLSFLKKKNKKIGVYVAHDDDSIIGVGGTIIKHREMGDDVFVVIFTDGENSHFRVFGFLENPSPQQVKEKRKKEIKEAMKLLGIKENRLKFLNQIDGESPSWRDKGDVIDTVVRITEEEKPDIIYSNYLLDPHIDHISVGKIVKNMLQKLSYRPEVYQFAIQGTIPDPDKIILISDSLETKRKALFEMKSQVLCEPYKSEGWQKQSRSILSEEEIKKFLGSEEVFRQY